MPVQVMVRHQHQINSDDDTHQKLLLFPHRQSAIVTYDCGPSSYREAVLHQDLKGVHSGGWKSKSWAK